MEVKIMTNYIPTIGVEVHVELKTKTKILQGDRNLNIRLLFKTNKQTSFLKYNMNAELKAILETYRVSFCFYVSITPLETKKLQA